MKKRARIAIVDDEEIVRESLAGWLQMDGYEVDQASSAEAALELLKSRRYNIIFLDIKMPGMDGIELLGHLQKDDPELAVVMITAFGSIDTAVLAMKRGAHDYLLKPFDPAEISVLIERIIGHQRLAEENEILKDQVQSRQRLESLVSGSRAMEKVFELILSVAETDTSVLVTGETGTGKGLVAKAIHAQSPRAACPFISVNCGAFTEHLLESELFGHERGAFTGAVNLRKGRFELAQGGTIFLDEVGEVGMKMQIDLLKVLDEKHFFRVGGSQRIDLDFRVISATNSNLAQSISGGSFRQDLFYRLNVIAIHVPPLRDRKEDIPILAKHFLKRFARELNKPVDKISREAFDEMMLHDWPGNVRELENAIERAVVIGQGREIQADALPFFQQEQAYVPQDRSIQEMEKSHIIGVLEDLQWNITRSATLLGIDRVTLYSRIKKYGLKKPSDQ
jgi:DNA-binding NtrC family response regulator